MSPRLGAGHLTTAAAVAVAGVTGPTFLVSSSRRLGHMPLFPHQLEAVAFLTGNLRAGLFDEQGLGKTASAISALRIVHRTMAKLKPGIPHRSLIVVPKSVLWNWHRELRTWAPELAAGAQVVTGTADGVNPNASVVIVSHTMTLPDLLGEKLRRLRWVCAVLDEAHEFRNPQAKRTRSFFGTRPGGGEPGESIIANCTFMWALTGTPMPNDPTELWSMLYAMDPKRLAIAASNTTPMKHDQFRRTFCEMRMNRFGTPKPAALKKHKVAEFRERLRGFSLRRLKSDALPDLPPVMQGIVNLTPDRMPTEVAAISNQLSRALHDAVASGVFEDPVEAFAAMGDTEEFARWSRLSGLAKVEPAVDMCASELRCSDEKLVVFAMHLDVIEQFAEGMTDVLGPGSVVVINGSVNAEQRRIRVNAFQTQPKVRVFVGQIRAAGTGITLTASRSVLLLEQSFVPGENAQAIDRCHRIGQTGTVSARFIALAGTADEVLVPVLEAKTAMIRQILDP